MKWNTGITSNAIAGPSFRRKLSLRSPVRSNGTEVTTSTGAEGAAGEYRGHWRKEWPHKVNFAVTWELTLSCTIPSPFISASLLQSAGDFQLPGCNHSSLHNLTFHPEPLICAWGAQLLSAEHSFPTAELPWGLQPTPTIKKPLAFMCNWVETRFKSRGFHWLWGILCQTQLSRNREEEQGQLLWGHPGSFTGVPSQKKVQTSHPEPQSSTGHSSRAGMTHGAVPALPGAHWCYQTRSGFSTGLNLV